MYWLTYLTVREKFNGEIIYFNSEIIYFNGDIFFSHGEIFCNAHR